jgi:hypothetical protein
MVLVCVGGAGAAFAQEDMYTDSWGTERDEQHVSVDGAGVIDAPYNADGWYHVDTSFYAPDGSYYYGRGPWGVNGSTALVSHWVDVDTGTEGNFDIYSDNWFHPGSTIADPQYQGQTSFLGILDLWSAAYINAGSCAPFFQSRYTIICNSTRCSSPSSVCLNSTLPYAIRAGVRVSVRVFGFPVKYCTSTTRGFPVPPPCR